MLSSTCSACYLIIIICLHSVSTLSINTSTHHSDENNTTGILHQMNEMNDTNTQQLHEEEGEVPSTSSDDHCWFDKNATRGDFHCSSKTCYNFKTGNVKYHRVYCERFKGRVERMDERSKKMIRKIREPIEKFNSLFKTSLRDWVALKFLDFVSKSMRLD